MAEAFDYVVVGLGALGSATAHQLARRGLSVLGLERFELGHHRGASHDTSRILRHSYHTPEYVRLTQDAYDDWARLSSWAGRDLVTVVGGLDLFPPDPAIPLGDYTASLTEVGIDFELLDVDAIGERWPQFALPAGTVGLYQDRGAIVPAGPGTAVDAGPRAPAGRRPPRPRRGRVGHGHLGHPRRRHDVHLRWRGAVRGRVDRPAAGAAGRRPAADGDAGAGDVLRAGAPGGLRAGPDAAVDLDGRAVVLRLPLLRRADDQGGAGLRRPGRRPGRPRQRARPGDARPPRRARGPDAARRRPTGAVAALPVRADPRPRLRDGPGARDTRRWSSASAPATASSSRRPSGGCSPTW